MQCKRDLIRKAIKHSHRTMSAWCLANDIDRRQFYAWLWGRPYDKNGIGAGFARKVYEQFGIKGEI